MQIGIIGAGHIGGTLARHWAKLGHDVRIANSRGPETLTALAAEAGAKAVTLAEAARAADVVVLSIPEKNVATLPRDLFADTAPGTVIVETTNYYPEYRDGPIAEIDAGLLDSEWVSQRIGRPVVKAFNNIAAASLRDGGKPKGATGRIALPVAGDSQEAKRIVIALIDAIGFDAIDAGPLASSWRQQPGTPAYCHDLDKAGLERALAEADKNHIADYRRAADESAKRGGAAQRSTYLESARRSDGTLPSPGDVLTFWFADPGRWWKKDPAFDAEIRGRFLTLHDAARRGACDDWLDTPRGTLAYIVLLDQFSRNMFRGSARMFESDARALSAARHAVDRGFDRDLSRDERMFLYMPFMHSEDIADQDRCVGLFGSALQGQLGYAEQHRDIVRRFGRFPHRNALLGRQSTSEELEFLKQPGSSF